MKLIKSLLLGSAAGLLAVAGAQAADLPSKKAAPAEYVKVCTAYGAGFFYIPGTDTCIKLNGLVFGGWQGFNPKNIYTPAYSKTGVSFTNTTNGKSTTSGEFFSRGRLGVDSRSETAYGTLRSFFRLQITTDSKTGTFAQGVNLDKGFVQWAGLTAGRAQSFFDFYADAFGPSGYPDIAGSDNTVNTLAYTATFGGGFQATLAVESARERQNSSAVGGITGVTQGGGKVPNVVGALRVDQGWGSAQLSAAYSNVPVVSSVSGFTPSSQNGWAVQGGVQINLPMLAAGDTLYLQAAYAQAALSYVGLGASNINFQYNSITQQGFLYNARDVVYNGFGMDKSKAWNVTAAFKHYFMPNFNVALVASYNRVTYNALTNVFLPDANMFVVGSIFSYSPVKNLEFNLSTMYARTNTSQPTGTVTVPTGVTYKKNSNDFFYRISARRDF